MGFMTDLRANRECALNPDCSLVNGLDTDDEINI